MVSNIFYAWGLVVSTVLIHAVGLDLSLRVLRRSINLVPKHLGAITGRLVGVACYLILLHVTEISIWAGFYVWKGCLPDFETALYFSGVTYTTVGFGDVVLAKQWRLFGLLEGLTGILMCGLSTGLFFAVLNNIYQKVYSTTDIELVPRKMKLLARVPADPV